jgi:hypothetical protein
MILRYDIADKKTILPSIPILKTLLPLVVGCGVSCASLELLFCALFFVLDLDVLREFSQHLVWFESFGF